MQGGWIIAAALTGFAAYCFARQARRPEIDTYGDVAFIPDEMRPVRKSVGGGSSEQGGRAGTGHVRTHDKGGF